MNVALRIALAAAALLTAAIVYAAVLHHVCGPDFDIFDGLWC